MVSVSFQGERGAYSEAAARAFFARRIKEDDIRTRPHPTFEEALDSTADCHTDYTILPVENSLEGSVGESYDLLMSTPLVASGEIHHRIRHCLIGLGTISDVRDVMSHSQALGQCRRFVREQNKRPVPAYDTAGSIKKIKDTGSRTVAGIASAEAAAIYGVPVIAEDIADNPNNYTRFLILSRDVRPAPTGCDKTSIIFTVRHEPGSLYKVMGLFYQSNINMTKIESRPTRGNAWEYNFYVDFEGHADTERVAGVLESIRQDAFVRVLGSYPRAAEP